MLPSCELPAARGTLCLAHHNDKQSAYAMARQQGALLAHNQAFCDGTSAEMYLAKFTKNDLGKRSTVNVQEL